MGTPPLLFAYELFLDETGAKISKSKGNGISIEEWLRYGTPEKAALFMFHTPQRAKRLYFDVIPKHVDDYLAYVEKLSQQDDTQQYSNPVWHIHNGKVPQQRLPVNFSLLLNLASACNPEHEAVLWGFISRYAPEVSPHNAPLLATLVQRAMAYYEHFVNTAETLPSPHCPGACRAGGVGHAPHVCADQPPARRTPKRSVCHRQSPRLRQSP